VFACQKESTLYSAEKNATLSGVVSYGYTDFGTHCFISFKNNYFLIFEKSLEKAFCRNASCGLGFVGQIKVQ